MENEIYNNEKWWQLNGNWWNEEVEKRRFNQPLYTVHEIILTDYFKDIPSNSKVLEFGCGFGRHLEYLNRLDNFSIYAVEQSSTMIEALSKKFISDKTGLLNRVKKIEPRTKLPFPDNFFDVTYTVSVLIHINPEHIQEIINELIRVTKYAILHFENKETDNTTISSMEHDGCWLHNIPSYYKQLLFPSKVYKQIARKQALYYFPLSASTEYEPHFNNVLLEKIALIDEKLGFTLENNVLEKISLDEKIATRNTYLNKIEKTLKTSKNKVIELFIENGDLSNHITSLHLHIEMLSRKLLIIESSISWKIVSTIKNNKFIHTLLLPPYSIINFFKSQRYKRQNTIHIENSKKDTESINIKTAKNAFKNILKHDHVVIYQPEWLGVSNSSKELFSFTLPLFELDPIEAKKIGDIIAKSNIKTVVFSGFACGYFNLALRIHKQNPKISIKLFWHGNTTHVYEDYSYNRFNEIIELYKKGIVDCLGFAKKSMAELYAHQGYKTAYIINKVSGKKDVSIVNPSKNTNIRIGIYASGNTWNKNAFTQIAAASLMENATISLVPSNSRLLNYAFHLGVNVESSNKLMLQKSLLNDMIQNDINFYVTFSECAPLLPLESLNLGVLCITGPNHNYFNNSELYDFLVCKTPDDPVEIAKLANVALKNKEKIFKLYDEWYKKNNNLSKESVRNFLYN